MNKGIWFAVAAYVMWGIFPVYFKLLHQVPAIQILGHRIVWSVAFLAVILFALRRWRAFRQAITPRLLLIYAVAACLLAANWYTYIWSVNSGFILEASLGYFINPLVNVLLGVIFLKERLKLSTWIPVALAAVGVIYLTVIYGALPWIALTLAVTFGLYGLMKKIAPLNALFGLSLETAILFLPALAFLLFEDSTRLGAFGHAGALTTVMLAFAGVVTAVPLLLFAGAAHRIPLSTMGLIQYLTPTLQFLFGFLVYGEPLTHDRLIGFGIIWLALALFSASGLWQRQRSRTILAEET